MRILLLEDQLTVAQTLRTVLQREGHTVDWCTRLAHARVAIHQPYDLLVLNAVLPDGPCMPWVRQLRAAGEGLPVLLMCPTAEAGRCPSARDAGADACVPQPVEPDVLCAQVRALQRRVTQQHVSHYAIGERVLDFTARKAWGADGPLDLTGREWTLLEALASRPGRVVAKKDLEALLTGFAPAGHSNVLEVHVSNLRRKLGRAAVQTVRGLGYRIGE